jgi:hypothetical protein
VKHIKGSVQGQPLSEQRYGPGRFIIAPDFEVAFCIFLAHFKDNATN